MVDLKPGIALLPFGPNGEKWGVDDWAANREWGIDDLNAYIYPAHEVFNMNTGEFIAHRNGLCSPQPTPGSENGEHHFSDRLPVLTVAEFLEEAPESYDWLAEGIAAKGAVTKIAGKAKEAGKTTFLMCMVSDLRSGTPFLGRKTKKSKVLYLSEQGSSLREALKDAGMDDPGIEGLHLLPSHLVANLDWKELMQQVRAYCAAQKIDLLVIDTLIDFSDVDGDEENKSGKVKRTLEPLQHLAKSQKVAVVFTQHHNLENRGRGSTQFDGEPDIIIDLYAPDQVRGDLDHDVRQLSARGRGVHYKQLVRFTKEDGYEALNPSDEAFASVSRKAKTVLRFLPVLEAEARTIGELEQALENADKKMSRTTLKRALDELKKASLACERGEGTKNNPLCFWRQEPLQGNGEGQETTDTNLCSPFQDPGVENGEHHFSASKIVPIRPDIEPLPPEQLADTFNYVCTKERLNDCRQWAQKQRYLSVDIETKGKNKNQATLHTKATVRLVTLHADDETWFLDCDHLEDTDVSELLRCLVDKPKYLHNAAFDIPRIYRRYGVLLNQHVRDTLVASRAARAGEWEEVSSGNKVKRPMKGLKLEECLARELGVSVPGGYGDGKKWLGDLSKEHLTYAKDDVAHLKELYEALYKRIEELGVKSAYDAITDTTAMFLESAALGVPVNAAMLENIQIEVGEEKEAKASAVKDLLPEHPENLEWVLGNTDKDTAPGGKGRAGMLRGLQLVGVKLPNLEEQTLLDNREQHPLVKALYEYRTVAAIHSKYRRFLPDFYENGRLYPQVKIAGAKTSRVLYTEPNIQGIDKKKTNKYRKCVRADEGYSIVKGDFAQQELRIAAYFSEDAALLSAFANGEDVYMRVAEKIAGEPVSRGTDEGENARAAAKRATLGYLYGLGPEKYRKNVYKDTRVEISEEDAHRDRTAFREAYPGLYEWQKKYGAPKDETNLPKADMWETRSVKGWRRVVEGQYERKSAWKKDNNVSAAWVPKYTERLNGPIQSTAGDILYQTLIKIDTGIASGVYPDTRFLFTAHDEVVLTCPEDVAQEVAAWLKAKMVESFEDVLGPELGGPNSVEVGGGPSWGECLEWVDCRS